MRLAMRSKDFGAAVVKHPWGWHLFGVLVWLGLIAAVVIAKTNRDRAAAIVDAKAWTIDGPPCPQLPPAQAARWPYQPKEGFDYAGVEMGFVYGHVACAQIHDDGGRSLFRGHVVCQFTSPASISVRTDKTTAFFTPGLGQRATISTQGGVARCVMAGRFQGQNDF
jgi:hypothetical protein